MIHISGSECLSDYRVRVVFDDGREGLVDLRPMVFEDPRPVFAKLRDASVFRQLFVERGVLCWPDGPDIAPEYAYFLAFRGDKSLRGLFEEWGCYIKDEVVV